MLQPSRSLIRPLVLVVALLTVGEGVAQAQSPTTGPHPDEVLFRDTVRTLRAELFSGWPSLCVAATGAADARPVQRALDRPFVRESGSRTGVGGVTLGRGYTLARIEIARVEEPDETTRGGYEKAYTDLQRWFLEEGGAWLPREGITPQEGLWEDSRCTVLYPVRRGHREHGIALWLRKSPISRDRSEWVLELTGYGREQRPGWTVARLREFLGSRSEKPLLAPFAEWFAAQGFDDADVLLAIDAGWVDAATERAVEGALTGLPTRRTARLLVQRQAVLHELIAPVAGAGPGLLQQLHERLDSGELTHDQYVKELGGFDWHLVGEVLASMDDDRATGFSNWIAGLPGIGGVYRLRPNPLSRNSTPRWQRLVVRGDLILLRTVLFHGSNPVPHSLAGYLRNHLRAALQDAGVETRYDLQVSFSDDIPTDGGSREFCIDLGLRDAALAAALKTCRHVTLEPLSGDCQDGWGTARLPETGETFEGFFERGLPAGVIRRVHPVSGAVLISSFRGATPHGPFLEVDPAKPLARVGIAKDGEVEELRWIPAWRGADGKSEFHTLDGLENGPVVAHRGTVLSGDPRDGRCVVEIPKLGKFTGSFVGQVAQGEGILETPSGRIYKIDCYDGVPRLVRTLRVPDGERLAFYEKHGAKMFPDGDCLSGDVRRGEGVAFLGQDDGASQIYRGAFLNGRPHGQGTLIAGTTRCSGEFVHGRFVPPPPPKRTAPRPRTRPRARPAPARTVRIPRFSTCKSCSGYGYVTTRGYYVDEVEVRPFMPGDRHFGSWIWSGYEVKTGRQTWQPGERIRCRSCGGTGRIRWR